MEGADRRAPDKTAAAIDPLFFLRRNQFRENLVPPEHELEIHVRRPDAMHAMFIRETPVVDDAFLPARKPATHALVSFEYQRFESALGEVKGGGQTRNAAARDE